MKLKSNNKNQLLHRIDFFQCFQVSSRFSTHIHTRENRFIHAQISILGYFGWNHLLIISYDGGRPIGHFRYCQYLRILKSISIAILITHFQIHGQFVLIQYCPCLSIIMRLFEILTVYNIFRPLILLMTLIYIMLVSFLSDLSCTVDF